MKFYFEVVVVVFGFFLGIVECMGDLNFMKSLVFCESVFV